jgi:hypothetical protein
MRFACIPCKVTADASFPQFPVTRSPPLLPHVATQAALDPRGQFTECLLGEGVEDFPSHVPGGPKPVTPHIRFLFVAPCFRVGLPSDPASQRRPCPFASLRLLLYLVRGLTPPKLRAMPGTHVAREPLRVSRRAWRRGQPEVALDALVCAQHGRVVNGVEVSCRRTVHGNMKRTTT